jgi:hypothetical protein
MRPGGQHHTVDEAGFLLLHKQVVFVDPLEDLYSSDVYLLILNLSFSYDQDYFDCQKIQMMMRMKMTNFLLKPFFFSS